MVWDENQQDDVKGDAISYHCVDGHYPELEDD